MTPSEPTISSILLELAEQYDGVVAERDVFARVLERRPSRAKDPYASIRNILRYNSLETGWVRLGGGQLIPRRSRSRGCAPGCCPAPTISGDLLARAKLEPFVLLRSTKPTPDRRAEPRDPKRYHPAARQQRALQLLGRRCANARRLVSAHTLCARRQHCDHDRQRRAADPAARARAGRAIPRR